MLELINQRRAAPEDLPGVQGGPFEAELPGRQASAHQAGPCVDCLLSRSLPQFSGGMLKGSGLIAAVARRFPRRRRRMRSQR